MTVRTSIDARFESSIGEAVRRERLALNIGQQTLAERANVSHSALRNLEAGRGSNLTTFVRVLRALGREDVLDAIHVPASERHSRYRDARPKRERASGS